MSATDPNMNMWLNPTPQGAPPNAPQPVPPAPAPPAQVAPEQPVQQAVPQQPVPAQQPQFHQDPQTGIWYQWNPATGQWEPYQQPQQFAPAPAPPAMPPAAPQMPSYAPPAPQPYGQQQFPPNAPNAPQQGGMSMAQQMEMMRQNNQQRAQSNGASLKVSLKGVQAGNFNLLDPALMYEGKVTSSTLKENKDKTHEMIELKITVTYPEQFRGTLLRNNLNLIEESLPFYRAALEAADLFNYETEEPALNTEKDFEGKFLRFQIQHQEYPKGSGTMRNAILGAFSKAFETTELQGQAQPNSAPNAPQQFAPPAVPPTQFTPPQQYAPPAQIAPPNAAPAPPNFGQ